MSAHYTVIAKGVKLRRVLSNELIEASDPGLCYSLSACAIRKKSSSKHFMTPHFFTRNRWWFSPGPHLQESHTLCYNFAVKV